MEIDFLPVLEAGNPAVSTVVSLRLLSLLQDGCLLPESLPGLPSVFVCVLIFSFYKDNSQTGLGPLT
jgi:hypothetical protein